MPTHLPAFRNPGNIGPKNKRSKKPASSTLPDCYPMNHIAERLFILTLLVTMTISCASTPSAQSNADEMFAVYGTDASNMVVVLRETEGGFSSDESFKPIESGRAFAANGTEIGPLPDIANFDFIGDMHIRFAFDGPRSMQNLTREEFEAFRLTPEEAVAVAIKNIKRDYGPPSISPWSNGIMMVTGKSPDLDSSYFLDREFWQSLLQQYPQGLVVGVPARGSLLFVPASDKKNVEYFRKSVGILFETSESMRVSSALYLFKDNRWSVFQPPTNPK